MKICILNGDMQTNGSLFTKQMLALADVLHPKHQVDIFHLADIGHQALHRLLVMLVGNARPLQSPG